jgi:hypothetical protein
MSRGRELQACGIKKYRKSHRGDSNIADFHVSSRHDSPIHSILKNLIHIYGSLSWKLKWIYMSNTPRRFAQLDLNTRT